MGNKWSRSSSLASIPEPNPPELWAQNYWNMRGDDEAPMFWGPSVATSYRGAYKFEFQRDITVHVIKNRYPPVIRLNYKMFKFILYWDLSKEWNGVYATKTFSFDDRTIRIDLWYRTMTISSIHGNKSHQLMTVSFTAEEKEEIRDFAYNCVQVINNYLSSNNLDTIPNIFLSPDVID